MFSKSNSLYKWRFKRCFIWVASRLVPWVAFAPENRQVSIARIRDTQPARGAAAFVSHAMNASHECATRPNSLLLYIVPLSL